MKAGARLEAYAREVAQRLLPGVNRLALELVEVQEAGEASPAAPTQRANHGIYLYAGVDPAAHAGA